jgi:DNA-binding beta-propeller fold protein YncE
MLEMVKTSLLPAAALALAPFLAQAQGKTSGLPDGPGKERVEALCMACHQAREILNSSGYTREGWGELIGTMIDLSRVPEERDRITQYLASHFPPSSRRAPTLVAGNERIAFTEWRTPTPGARARDPIQDSDGAIWYAGQWSNQIGRIDPATGKIQEYALPANAKPHTVTLDARGNVWYTGNGNATLGYLDPRSGKITEFKMPDPQARIRTRLCSTPRAFSGSRCSSAIAWVVSIRRAARSGPSLSKLPARGPTASRSPPPTAPPGSRATGARASCASIRRRWSSRKCGCRARIRRSGGSTSPATGRSGT